MSRSKTFWYHYNKPASQAAGEPRVTVHHAGVCHIVKNVDIRVPTSGRLRKRQPRFVITGRCRSLQVRRGVAVIS